MRNVITNIATPISQDNDNWYMIELNKEKIAAQKANAISECFLNGFTIIPKNITNDNNATLNLKNKLREGINPSKIKISEDTNIPIVKNDIFLRFNRCFSLNTPIYTSI